MWTRKALGQAWKLAGFGAQRNYLMCKRVGSELDKPDALLDPQCCKTLECHDFVSIVGIRAVRSPLS